jgi:hypothetical protein
MVKNQVAVFWVMIPHADVVGYHHFRQPCCHHLLDEVKGTIHFTLKTEAAGTPKMLVSYCKRYLVSQPRRPQLKTL